MLPQHRQPRISVVIPTRNRAEYLPCAIDTVLSQAETNFELVVSDNHSSDGTVALLERLRDPRLRVVRPDRPLAMVDHFEWVLDQARGEWMTIIGDDDGLMPFFFGFTNSLLDILPEEFDAMVGPRALYFWPGLDDLYGTRAVDLHLSDLVREVEPSRTLRELAHGRESYFDAAQFYTGTVFRRSLVQRLRHATRSGRVFHSVSPDAASVASILLESCRVLRLGMPLAWVGSSPKSNGAQSALQVECARASAPTFADFRQLNADAVVRVAPRFRTLYTVGTSAHLCFLEALHETARARGSDVSAWFEGFLSRHRLFAELHRTRLARKAAGLPVDAYETLLVDNRCHDPLLSALLWERPFRRIHRSLAKRVDRLRWSVMGGKPRSLTFRWQRTAGLDSIVQASARLQSGPIPGEIERLQATVLDRCSRLGWSSAGDRSSRR